MPPTREHMTLVNNPLQVKSQMTALTQTSLVVFVCCTCTNFLSVKVATYYCFNVEEG